jgi:Icc-related predicted phosphoesterase
VSTILFASDLHGNAEAYEALFRIPADAIVLGGDLLPHPRGAGDQLIHLQRRFAQEFLAPRLRTRPCFWILGNDDWEAAFPLLESSATPIHGRAVPFLDGLSIAGYSCVPVTPFGMKDFDRYDSEGWEPRPPPTRCLISRSGVLETVGLDTVRARGTIAADLQRLAALSDPARTVYVIHSPPARTRLDRLVDGTSIGSEAIRAFLERRQPPLSLHGHIHESPGVERLGRTVAVNPGDSVGGLQAVRVDLGTFEVTPLRRR